MDFYAYTNQQGVELFHLIHHSQSDELGIESKKLVSSIPAELLRMANRKIYGLFELESKRIESDWKMEMLESLARSVASNPLTSQFCYPKSILGEDGTMTARKLNDMVKWIDDLNLVPGDFFSENIHPVKHFVLCSKFFQCREFQFRDFVREIKILSRANFERGLNNTEQWQGYKTYIGKKGLSYLSTKTKRKFDCNILFVDGKPVMEYIC